MRLVMSYKVTENAELANADPLLLRYRAGFLWAADHTVSMNWSTHNLVQCVFLFKYALIYTVASLTLNSKSTAWM